VKNVLQEIHDRSLWQILGLYLASSWVVLQVVDTLDSVIGLPSWVASAAIALLVLGLPIVLITAFVQKGWGRRTSVESPAEGRPLFTWRNAVLGGGGAFALLGIGTAVWLAMRAAGIGPAGTLVAKGVLEERDLILLADFDNATGDPTLANVVTEALRVDLAQSEAVRLADDGFISDALDRMQRPEDSALDEELARELARREGIKAVVTGDVARAGSGYALTARVITPEEGEILVSHRESARDSTRLLDAIDALSRRVRERIGDPLKLLAASPPLAQVTTSNLEALRAYTQASRLPQADAQRKLALYAEAVALDSTFGAAWNALAIQLGNYGAEPGRVMEARTKAFELRDRLTERERNAIASMYYMSVTGEPRQAIPYLEALREIDPTGRVPLNNLGEAYRELGDLETAIGWYERAAAADSAGADIPLMNIAQVKTTMGDLDGALAASDLLEVYAPGPFAAWHRGMVAAGRRDFEAAEAEVGAARDSVTGSPFLRASTTQWLASIVGIRGRLAESRARWEEAAAIQAANGSPVEALRNLVAVEVIDRMARGTADREGIEAALSRYPLADMDPLARPYLDVAETWALLGFPEEARSTLTAFEAVTPENFQRGFRYQRHLVSGEIALEEGRIDDAIAEFRQSASRPQELAPLVQLARAFDAAGNADSARVYYRRFLEQPHWLSVIPYSTYLAGTLERSAALEYDAGNLREAAARLAELVALWAGADEELQPRVQAAQARLQQILEEIG